MAQKMLVQPMICLRWVTERPYAGGSRQSSDFRFLSKEWYLEMKLKDVNVSDGTKRNFCEILLYPRPCPGITSNYLVDVDCHLKVRDKWLEQSTCLSKESKRIFNNFLPEIKISPSVEEWTVICMFKDTETCKSFSLVAGDRIAQLSPDVVRIVKFYPFKDDKSVQASPEVPRDIESLSSDFSRLMEKEILPDVKLECKGKTFQAHRSVLAARSEVFRAMFENVMLESETRTIKIQDMDIGVLEKFLKFLYSGKPDGLSEDCIVDLYEAADKYEVLSLQKACAYWIERNLTVENCVNYLKVTDSHSDCELKAAVMSFIIKNPSVMKSEAWLSLSKQHPVLANEVLQAYVMQQACDFCYTNRGDDVE